MTLEDFAESVAAGWLPLLWGSVWHVTCAAGHWLAVHGGVFLAVWGARLRK